MDTPAVFTRDDRADQDAELAVYYAEQAAIFKRQAVLDPEYCPAYLKLAREFRGKVYACAARLEVRLQLLDDQRAGV